MAKIFIDGSAGTTGLKIRKRLKNRADIELITLPDELRKDVAAKTEALNSADIAFLCLPDAAAIESVSLIHNKNTAVIDTSTAHRTASGWDYGFPELGNKREQIAVSKRVANPGCHASGFIALVYPLISEGLLKADARLSCISLTGYSGGGKNMISEYESENRSSLLAAPRQYGLSQQHKHLKEMSIITGLRNAPAFMPVVAPFYSGMEVTVPLFANDIKGGIKDIAELYKGYYNNGLVYFNESPDEGGFMSAAALSGTDKMEVSVHGNDERIILVSRFDNLGKGASGAAIQNMNIILGANEAEGLVI